MRNHASPLIGKVKAGALDPEVLDSIYAELRHCRQQLSRGPADVLGTLLHESSFDRGRDGRIRVVFEPFAVTEPGTQAGGQLLSMAQDIESQGPDQQVKDQLLRPRRR